MLALSDEGTQRIDVPGIAVPGWVDARSSLTFISCSFVHQRPPAATAMDTRQRHAVAVVTSDLRVLLIARFVSGTTHGLFVGVASVVAVTLVPPANQGRAMSMVFGGIAVATVLGVPLGTAIAQLLDWRAVFAGISVLAVIVLLAAAGLVTSNVSRGAGGFSAQARGAFAPRVLLMLLVGAMLLGGQFAAFTYLVPYLQDVTQVPRELISVFLLIYGAASAVGVFVGGRFADKSARLTLVGANLLLLPALSLLYLFGDHLVLAACALAAWGVIGFGLVPALQLRVISLAGCGRDLAATLSASAANAGIAMGSLLGGRILERHGMSYVVLVSIAACALAAPLTLGHAVPKAVRRGEGCIADALKAIERARPPRIMRRSCSCGARLRIITGVGWQSWALNEAGMRPSWRVLRTHDCNSNASRCA